MNDVPEIIDTLIWPLVILIFCIAFVLIFRSQIGHYIQRIRSVSRDGVHTDTDIIQANEAKSTSNILQHIEIEKTVMLKEVEQAIFDDLKTRELDYSSDTTIVLVRNLALAQIGLQHEQTYSTIFGSQLLILKKLNESSGIGQDEDYLEGVFLATKNKHEDAFANWEFSTYIKYLTDRSLITRNNKDKWHITDAGQDFLLWLVKNGKNEFLNY